jgi:tetratricopeptide (TPR) repeat protein
MVLARRHCSCAPNCIVKPASPATAEKLLRPFLLSKAEPSIRAQGWYELGSLLDRQGGYDEAMKAFLEAKTLLSPNAGPHLAELKIVRARLERLKAGLSADKLQCWLDCAPELSAAPAWPCWAATPAPEPPCWSRFWTRTRTLFRLEETTIFHDDAYMPLTRKLPDDTPMLSVLEAATTDTLRQSRANYLRSAELFLGEAHWRPVVN